MVFLSDNNAKNIGADSLLVRLSIQLPQRAFEVSAGEVDREPGPTQATAPIVVLHSRALAFYDDFFGRR